MDALIRVAAVIGVAVLVTFIAYGIPALLGRLVSWKSPRTRSAHTSGKGDRLQ